MQTLVTVLNTEDSIIFLERQSTLCTTTHQQRSGFTSPDRRLTLTVVIAVYNVRHHELYSPSVSAQYSMLRLLIVTPYTRTYCNIQ